VETPALRAAAFTDLPGWRDDPLAQAMPALRLQCQRLALLPPDTALGGTGIGATYAGQYLDPCAAANAVAPGADPHAFFEAWFRPYHVTTQALVTGYFEPLVAGSLHQVGAFQVPVYARPTDLREGVAHDAQGRPTYGRMDGDKFVPYYTRAEIEAGKAGGATHPIAWLTNPLDLFFAQIQGSMLLQLPEGGTLRLAFDGRNGRPYTPIGRVLEQRGALAADQVSLQSIRAWLAAHPAEQKSVMDQNESYVFFRAAADAGGFSDPTLGPTGALGVALTAGRSVAVDKRFLPIAAPVFLDTTLPDHRVWRHLTLAQDVGSAIEGTERFDIFLGSGPGAEAWAGGMRQAGQAWVLLPRGAVKAGPLF
jgi:membrane-bound lytic murein transglycosylase A